MSGNESDVVVAWRTLVNAHGRLIKIFTAELQAEFSLKPAEYDALRWLLLADDGGMRMQDLARSLLYTSGAATKVIDRLVARDLVARRTDADDKRVVWVRLTDAGEQLALEATTSHRARVVEEIGPFDSPEEQRHVQAFLTRLAGRRTP